VQNLDRDYLLGKLQITKPGLSSSDLIPVLSHYWFSAGRLTTYNDEIGISIPCKTDIVGAVPGVLLYAMIDGLASGKPIIPSLVKDELHLQSGRSKIKLAMLKADAFVFTFPKPEPKNHIPVEMGPFVEAIECCLRSADNNAHVPEYLGVTMMLEGNEMKLFGTDGQTLAHGTCKLSKPVAKRRAVLSVAFCKQLVALAKGAKNPVIELAKDYIMLTFGVSSYLFGKLMGKAEKDLDYDYVLKRNYTPAIAKQAIPIVERFEQILDMSVNITEGPSRDAFTKMREASKGGTSKTQISVVDNTIKFHSRSMRGEYSDQIALSKSKHPDCKLVYVDPQRMREGCLAFDKILIQESSVLMLKGQLVFLVSGTSSSED
jgi:DNA polymerase III sliding clamp (beta) subunit (PCNA family)